MGFVPPEQLLKVLFGFNPWWSTGSVPRELVKPFRRAAFYRARDIMLHPQLRRAVLLSGARRVGKTTIIYQMIDELLRNRVPPERVFYASLDHPLLKFFQIGEILEAYQENVAAGEAELFLFFDEVQYATHWDRWIKLLHDQNPGFRIVLTGSASPVLASGAIESGVGRWVTIRIPTLSFYEYVKLRSLADRGGLPEDADASEPFSISSQEIDPMAPWLHDPKEFARLLRTFYPLHPFFHRYLLIGGFPELACADDMGYAQRLLREDVVDKALKRDLVALFGVRNVNELERVFLYLCIHSGNVVSFDTIAKEAGTSRPTVANYIHLLEVANLISVSEPIEVGAKKVLKARPKVYLADSSIRLAVLMMSEAILADPEEMGMLVETLVHKHVVSLCDITASRVGYFRDSKTEKEVDIVISQPRGLTFVEVKYRDELNMGKNEAIMELLKDPKALGGIIITKRPEDFGPIPVTEGAPLVKVPAYAWLYLIGLAEETGRKGFASLHRASPQESI